MADNSMLIKLGVAGALGYFAYTQGWLSFLNPTVTAPAPPPATGGSGTQTNSAPATASAPAPSASAPPAISDPFKKAGLTTIDAVFQKLASAGGLQTQQTADDWNWDMMNLVAPGWVAPDPMSAGFANLPYDSTLGPWTRDRKIPIGVYWVVIGPQIRQSSGLSGVRGGMGLYHAGFTGLNALARQHRRVG